MSTNIINFRPKQYGLDYHREEMECTWVTTKGVLLTFFDEVTGEWHHEWSPTEQWMLEQAQRGGEAAVDLQPYEKLAEATGKPIDLFFSTDE
jgi:hypothetical protein